MNRPRNTAAAMLPRVSAELADAVSAVCATATRVTDRLARAHDASHYLLTPQIIATPSSAAQVAQLFSVSRRFKSPLTFRSGGTSLSGQAGTDSVLVDTRREFRQLEVLDGGRAVRAEPGVTVRMVNARLSRHGRKLGPDPASEIACTVGGVVANNSSGMVCGTAANAYRTLRSAVLVLPTGTVIDTASPSANQTLRRSEPDIYDGLIRLRERIRRNDGSMRRIQELYSIKNTMGYGLNSFVDYDDPVSILEHLVVGSEGTLAFVAQATFETVPVNRHVATGLLLFNNLGDATSALPYLVEAGFAAIELLDSTSLRVAQRDPEATDALRQLQVVDQAALLVEYQEPEEDDLRARLEQASEVLSRLPIASSSGLTADSEERAKLWHLRKGLYTLVAGNRPSGTTALLEDIAVPVENLYRTCSELVRLFDKYGYEDSVIFGHAKDGNIHFMLNERFDNAASLARYEAFTEEMVELVLSEKGTLKAEHGTGRIMAPYVRRQYGDELYDVMREVKLLIDPDALLNPGVLLPDETDLGHATFKTAPTVEAEVDRCVECGYCEPVCPSRDLTLTPRERIVLRREMARAESEGNVDLLAQLRKEYDYDGIDTCAVDGMCQTACPVLINTGDLVRRLRAENTNQVQQASWAIAARHWDTASVLGGLAMTAASTVPAALPRVVTTVGRALFGTDTVPEYSAELPPGGRKRRQIPAERPAAVYFPSCTNTMFGPVGEEGVSESFRELCRRAGVSLTTPQEIPSLCCGTPWKSKGLTDGYEEMKRGVAKALMDATNSGELPVVCDASSCTEGLQIILDAAGERGIRVVDAVQFVDEVVLAALPPAERKIASVTLHPTCSSVQLGIHSSLVRVASAAADEVVVPEDWGCCAFAGDRGMLHPELTASATHLEAKEVQNVHTEAHASLNRTCELGMTRATGKEYRHILQLLAEAHSG